MIYLFNYRLNYFYFLAHYAFLWFRPISHTLLSDLYLFNVNSFNGMCNEAFTLLKGHQSGSVHFTCVNARASMRYLGYELAVMKDGWHRLCTFSTNVNYAHKELHQQIQTHISHTNKHPCGDHFVDFILHITTKTAMEAQFVKLCHFNQLLYFDLDL